jgi:AcrR family transcriptional regulator
MGRERDARDLIIGAARRRLRTGPLPSLEVVAAEAGVSRATLHRSIGSRAALLRLLEVEPDPGTRERVIAMAVELLGTQGLARLSMDELAERAGVSRATLYRLFPGKPALFHEVVRVHAPFAALADVLAAHGDDPPDRVMPLLARTAVAGIEGRLGLFRAIFFEVTGPNVDAELARDLALAGFIRPLVAYVAGQMARGRLREMPPLLALQAFAGPLIMHVITRELAERALGFTTPLRDVVDELVAAWLRLMSAAGGRRP